MQIVYQALAFFLYTFAIVASITTIGALIMFLSEWWKGRK